MDNVLETLAKGFLRGLALQYLYGVKNENNGNAAKL